MVSGQGDWLSKILMGPSWSSSSKAGCQWNKADYRRGPKGGCQKAPPHGHCAEAVLMRVGPGGIPGRKVEGIDFVRLTVGIVEFVAAPKGESTTTPARVVDSRSGSVHFSKTLCVCPRGASSIRSGLARRGVQILLVSVYFLTIGWYSGVGDFEAMMLQQCLRSAC